MRATPPSSLLHLVLMLAVLGPLPALAAKKTSPGDTPPLLLSKDGPKPKWTTLEQVKQAAAKGDPAACFELADRCSNGDGLPLDYKQAATLFEQAAKGGVANGWYRLGKIYHDGLLAAPDYGLALEYFTTAARAGVVEAQHNIGAMLVSARGVKRDYVEGLAWLIVARKSGDPTDAEVLVRNRLAKRPADIQAAETRAAEISKDPSTATVRAVRPGVPAAPAVETPKLPPATPVPAVPMDKATLSVPVEKTTVAAPTLEAPTPIQFPVPLPPPPAPPVPAKP
jgi:hypothetical protein